jgi:hypothetical protein
MSKFYQWQTRYGKVNEHHRLVPQAIYLSVRRSLVKVNSASFFGARN